MAILNVTPDSFSDGGRYASVDDALKRVEKIVAEGADIIDIGGESTRPESTPVSVGAEIDRTIPVIEAIVRRFDVPISIDTTKSEVARLAVDAGAEIINDISGLRFDGGIAEIAGRTKAGLVLMHSRGTFESIHSQPPVDDIFTDVVNDLRRAISTSDHAGVVREQIVLDVGIGFGKTFAQNLELLGKLDRIVTEFPDHPILVGASRKSFIGKVLTGVGVEDRLSGSLASAAIAVFNGAKIIRAHDVKETVAAVKVASTIKMAAESDV